MRYGNETDFSRYENITGTENYGSVSVRAVSALLTWSEWRLFRIARTSHDVYRIVTRIPDQVVIAFPLSHLAANIIVVSSWAGKLLSAGNTHNAFSLDVQINGPAGTRTMRGFRSDRLRDWWMSTSTHVAHVITRATAIIANVYQHSAKSCLTPFMVISSSFDTLPRWGRGSIYFGTYSNIFVLVFFSFFLNINNIS